MNVSKKRLIMMAELAKASYDIPQFTVGETGVFAEFNGGELRIAFSGTDSFDDVLADCSFFPKNGEHSGFARYADELLVPVINLINSYCGGHPYFITLIGHSLGAAIAQIIAKRLNDKFKYINVFTFGSPKVYTRWSQPKGISHYRIYHRADPVPKLLMFLFKHNQSGMCELGHLGLDFDDHKIENYIKELEQ